jgi:hypothetical protein
MFVTKSHGRLLIAQLMTAGCLIAYPTLVHAQTMSFSVYTDASSPDDLTLYMTANVVDNSSGCSHGGYTTTAHITSPSGRVAMSTQSGLQSTTSLQILAESGDFQLDTSGQYTCSCIFGGTAGYGGSAQVQPRVPTYIRKLGNPRWTQGPPYPYRRIQSYQVFDKDCFPMGAGHQFSETYGPISRNATDPACLSTIKQGGGPTDGSGSYDDEYSLQPDENAGTNPSNPCYSKATQTQMIDTKSLASRDIVWTYSDLTIGDAAACTPK